MTAGASRCVRTWSRRSGVSPWPPSRPKTGEAAAVDGDDRPAHPGLFIALEGGEGAGKTTQARMLSIWLREQGFDVVTTP